MKKALFVLALAVVLVLAFATTAFAYTPAIGLYIAWDGTGVNSNGPHADYQTATTKCAVCHSVHMAPGPGQIGNSTTGGWTGTAGTKPELLLTTSVADACSYCHIQTSMGGVQIYGGDVALYTGASAAGWVGHRSACVMCHAVHGANTFKGDLTSKIVKVGPISHGAATAIQPELLGGTGARAGLFDAQASAVNAPGLKYEQETAFCSQCHANFSRSADQDIVKTGGTRSHSMVAAPSSSFTSQTGGIATQYDATGADNGVGTATVNEGATNVAGSAIALYGSGTCRACHMAGGVDQTGVSYNSFPHYSNTFEYYLPGTVAYNDASLTANGAAGAAVYEDTALDGNCLVCHAGFVGVSF